MRPALALALCLAAGAAQSQDLTDGIGGDFALIDQTGQTRGAADPDGQYQLLFFGYANCLEICSAALPLMAEVAELVEGTGPLRPVLITVDPARDTVEALGPALTVHDPDFVGLTGTPEALQVAYDAFEVEFEELFIDPFNGAVFSHGSFIYLLDGDGAVLTLLPPVLGPQQMAAIVAGYMDGAS